MLHPIYSTVLGHPELIADHIANYSALIRQEVAQASRGLIVRAVAGVLAVVSALLALGLAGVAVMLGSVNGNFHWALVIVPGVALLIAAVAAYLAMKPVLSNSFDDLKAQLSADMHAMHVAGGRNGR
ncbi:phage holin family protein [Variovorax sp. RHLX14]|uniref:phage holin family protein n=1 Tax=Variovorax sp. RHLX14 TaxID=1259731 RepID=UPI003F44FA28